MALLRFWYSWLLENYPLVITMIGYGLAHAFAVKTNNDKSLDDYVKEKKFWGVLKGDLEWFGNKFLFFFHHYYIGIIGLYITNVLKAIPGVPWYPNELLSWFFFGIFIEDGFYHIREFLGWIQQELPKPDLE